MQWTGPDGPDSEQTRDDTDVGWGGAYDEGLGAHDDDRRLVEERPPHHDRP